MPSYQIFERCRSAEVCRLISVLLASMPIEDTVPGRLFASSPVS